jgi:hypothetical protein
MLAGDSSQLERVSLPVIVTEFERHGVARAGKFLTEPVTEPECRMHPIVRDLYKRILSVGKDYPGNVIDVK